MINTAYRLKLNLIYKKMTTVHKQYITVLKSPRSDTKQHIYLFNMFFLLFFFALNNAR